MTAREWKPGDVARVNGSVAVRADDNLSWWTTSGRLSDCNVAYARPLVVIDPEDREQVERLARLVWPERLSGELTDRALQMFTDALREFANPTPPKPDEPHGLGAVVKDEDGYRWVYSGGPQPAEGRIWFSPNLNGTALYAEIDAVRVLSEGVQP